MSPFLDGRVVNLRSLRSLFIKWKLKGVWKLFTACAIGRIRAASHGENSWWFRICFPVSRNTPVRSVSGTPECTKYGAYFCVVHSSQSHHSNLFHTLSPPTTITPMCNLPLHFPTFFALPLVFQVRGSQQGFFSCSADARCPGKSLGHVGWLPWEHLRKGPPTPLGSFSHYLLPPCLSPSEWEQVSQIPRQGEYEHARKIDFLSE